VTISFKNPKNYCRDPDCPDCDPERGECTGPNICTCKVGFFGDTCKVEWNSILNTKKV